MMFNQMVISLENQNNKFNSYNEKLFTISPKIYFYTSTQN